MSDESTPIESLRQKFADFLKTFKDDEGRYKYEDRIKQMIVDRRKSIIVDYEDLVKYDVKLFDALTEKPEEVLHAFSEAIKDVVQEFDEEYSLQVSKFIPRLSGLPITISLRDLSSEHINKLVMIEGILVRATPPKQKMFKAIYAHILPTGEIHEFEWPPLPSDEITDELERPAYCPLCKEEVISERGRGFSRGIFRLIVEKSRYKNWQKVVLQERPEEVPAGHIPRSVEVVLTDDVVDMARPGDRVSIIGVVKLLKEFRRKSISPVFNVYIEANNVIVAQKFLEEVKLGRDDEDFIRKLGRDPLIRRKIIASVAPSIYGLWDIKESIALQLFGGIPKVAPDGTKIRGDIHILIVGDPGTAKSQILQYVSRIAPRGLYTTGKGSSAAGLCVGGNTLICSDKGLLRIRNLVEDHLTMFELDGGMLISLESEDVSVASYLGDRASYSPIRRYYMLWSDKTLRLKTSLGIDLVTTPETKLLVYENGIIKWKEARTLCKGDYLVTVRKLPEHVPSFDVLDALTDDVYVKVKKEFVDTLIRELLNKFTTINNLIKTTYVSRYCIYNLIHKHVIRLHHLKLLLNYAGLGNIPIDRYIDEVGYRGFKGVNWVKLPLLNQEFSKLLSQALIKGSVEIDKHGKPNTLIFRASSHEELSHFINMLNRLFNIRQQLKIYRRGSKYVSLVRNRALAILLHSFGVPSTDGEISYKVVMPKLPENLLIYLIRDLISFNGLLSPTHVRILIPNRGVAELLHITLRRFGILSFINESRAGYELMVSDPKSLKNIGEVVLGEVFEVRNSSISANNLFDYIDLADDLVGVKVVSVSESGGEYVYDLTVDDSHSFIANGYIVHNTAAVIKEKQSGEYFLEAGAMVLADGGTVCIDEIDKMRDEDRVAIHEAMEQGTVSIAKAGIVARLNARASVLAAGNPKYGRYIPSRPIAENINLPITILSRFDLIFTLRDLTNLDRDKSLVRHVLKSHESIEEVRPEIPPDILRKYIAYARKYVKPKLTKEAEILIEEFYLEMRKKSAETPEAPIAITTRQLEALVRLAEAHARMALKNYVDAEDAAEAIRLMNVMLENVGIDLETGHIDIDVIMTGKPKSVRDKELIIKDIIRELSSESDCAKIKDVVKEAVKRGIDEEFVEKYLMSLRRVGELYEARTGCINFID
ncbi:MAG: hypothetical protein QXO98_05260 [Sulfolobales archaeon]